DAQAVSRRTGQPLLIMTDQEGGVVTRLPGTSDVPGGAQFDGDAAWARRTAAQTGSLMRRLGINTDLAPDADVDTASGGIIGQRSFGSDPRVVSRLVRAQICGYHAGGVAAAVKHFPGHGSTDIDSHLHTATIEESKAQWRSTDLPPFATAVRAHADLILVGHLAFPALDPSGRPATISAKLNRAQIRDRLGYHGVVVTDALNMGGVTSWGSTRDIAVRSIRAGSDLLLMPPQPATAVRAIVGAVDDGSLSRQRLNRSVERVLRLKQRLGLYADPARLPTC
ncbi:MAG: glycoside hydrolase family 3 protein, partial [Nocardioidaceae bacterium]